MSSDRMRDVATLDEWADKCRKARPLHHIDITVRFDTDGRYVVFMPGRMYTGDTPDAARAAAAAWVRKQGK